MSAEHGSKKPKFFNRRRVGYATEVGGAGLMAYGAAEILAASVFWPIAIGGAVFLLGRGLVRSSRQNQGH